MDIFLNFLFLVLGFALLIKGADYLVEGASSLAKRLSVSEMVIGLTIISFGTSAPELVVNIISSIEGTNGLIYGNIIGSNLFNILLVLGVAGVIAPIQVAKNTVYREAPFSLLGAMLVYIMVNDQIFNNNDLNALSTGEGLTLLAFFILFLVYAFAISKDNFEIEEEIHKLSLTKTLLFVLGGLTALAIGGDLVVTNAVRLAEIFGVSEKLIGLTIVAAGTSLPELFTSAIAVYKGRNDIAIGNVVGSNIFNIFFVLGSSALVGSIDYDLAINEDLSLMIFASVLLLLFMFTGRIRHNLNRLEAAIFLLIFVGYMVYAVYRG